MNNPDVFISYNREDAAIARTYADALTGAGLAVWWDATLRSGEDYDAVTEKSLRTAKAVVVLWSPRSVNSRWVRAEATIADRGHTLMPVMIEPCDRPVMFELKQTVELTHWRGDLEDKAWLAFVADLRDKIGHAQPEPVVPAVAAPVPAAAPAQDRAGPVSAGRSTVAVLPVGCRGGDADLEILAEDLTEDMTRELAHNGHFRVIAAGSMAAWRGKPIDHKVVGRQLEARYLVEGKLQRSGKNTRLTAQLIDGNTGNVLWSTRLVTDTDGAEFSADTLPVAAAAQFAEQIVQREQTRAMAKRAPFSAWDHILRSAANSSHGDDNGSRLAVDEARLAVATAPDIGLAHAVLASALAALPESQGLRPGAEEIREIQTETRQAMRLDGNNPSVLMALAGAYKGLGEYEICLRLARRIVDLWPSSPLSYLILGNSYRLLGRAAEAVTAYRKQDQIAPFDSSRNVALTCLGECLLAEGQPEAAEDALDRALTLDPEYRVALEWKAIIADHLGKERAALDAIRQLRSADANEPLDQHVWQIERDDYAHDRTAAHVATLHRLWQAADGLAAAPEVVPELAGVAVPDAREQPAEPIAAEALVADEFASEQSGAVVAELAGPEPDVAFGPGAETRSAGEPAGGSSAIPLKSGKPPVARRAHGKPPARDINDPPFGDSPAPAPVDEYLISLAGEGKTPTGAQDQAATQAANDDAPPAVAARRSALPRVAILGGAIALAGIGGAVWFSGGPDKANTNTADTAAPVAALAAITASTPVGEPVTPVQVPAAHQPLADAMAALINASRNAGRPSAELAALVAGQQRLATLASQISAEPANSALTQQLNGTAADLVHQQGAALSRDADRWLQGQEQTAATAKRGLARENAGLVDRALTKARGARAELAGAVAAAGRITDATTELGAARNAVTVYRKLAGSPVAAAVASARAAEADVGRQKQRLARARVEIENVRGEIGRLSGRVSGLAAIEKPGLFASGAKRQSYKQRKDNAEQARALAAEADRAAAAAGSQNDAVGLEGRLARLRSLRGQVSNLLSASNAALRARGGNEDKAKADTK
jgi:TolB-like protein